MVRTEQTMMGQLIARAVIFVLFFIGIFIVVPILRYLFMLFIIANVVLGFINGKRSLPMNIAFIILTPGLFIPVLEYLITIILVVLTGINLLMFYSWYKDGGKEEKENVEKEKKKFHISGWLIAGGIIVGILLLLVVLALFSFAGVNYSG
jgi:hypothetical protein